MDKSKVYDRRAEKKVTEVIDFINNDLYNLFRDYLLSVDCTRGPKIINDYYNIGSKVHFIYGAFTGQKYHAMVVEFQMVGDSAALSFFVNFESEYFKEKAFSVGEKFHSQVGVKNVTSEYHKKFKVDVNKYPSYIIAEGAFEYWNLAVEYYRKRYRLIQLLGIGMFTDFSLSRDRLEEENLLDLQQEVDSNLLHFKKEIARLSLDNDHFKPVEDFYKSLLEVVEELTSNFNFDWVKFENSVKVTKEIHENLYNTLID